MIVPPSSICPACKEGQLMQRRRRSDGKPFLGCDRYPACTYAVDGTIRPASPAPVLVSEFMAEIGRLMKENADLRSAVEGARGMENQERDLRRRAERELHELRRRLERIDRRREPGSLPQGWESGPLPVYAPPPPPPAPSPYPWELPRSATPRGGPPPAPPPPPRPPPPKVEKDEYEASIILRAQNLEID